ncbi:hypothetical protein MMG00_02300 [Ignatzschineria rhizosphaerae]|uniref:Uncharacterized protein n=1 Tax=Ignatzschineria rhizosphaerae TaxID=2923279 RepID=A0ABY3X9Q8_9GAMM|nr:hypothetical protein [Ignatzschineria rhizosphaerae]UNM96708.1 hypothetical protein MMG00_02300 [Ignatzschineria rhizosphaerae]
MEFVIEEIESSKSALKNKKRIPKIQLFKAWITDKVDRYFTNMTIQKELWLAGLSMILCLLFLIGRDVLIAQRQKAELASLDTNIRALSQQQQQLQIVFAPLSVALQALWLRTYEENIADILEVITVLSSEFKDPLIVTSLQKYPQDPHIYLNGKVKTYERIYQLETLLAAKKWQAIVNLSAKETDYYHYHVQIALQKE